MPTQTLTVERNLRLVFIISGVLLLVSSVASYLSIENLVGSSKWVNHTYDVLLGTDSITYNIKEGESAHRGYILTRDPSLKQAYDESYRRAMSSFAHVKALTEDNPRQQEHLRNLRSLIDRRFAQFENVLEAVRIKSDSLSAIQGQLLQGKSIMDQLTTTVSLIGAEEQRLLGSRSAEQRTYIRYTPLLIVLAASISILITLLAYMRISRDLRQRIAKQIEEQKQYAETTRRIADLQKVTRAIASGNYATRSKDTLDDELGTVSTALNEMAAALETNINELKKRNWVQTASVTVGNSLRGHVTLESLGNSLSENLAMLVKAQAIAFYTAADASFLQLQGGYALKNAPQQIAFGEGLTGQAAYASEMMEVDQLPENYFQIASALGQASPRSLTLVPVKHSGRLAAVIEIGTLQPLSDAEKQLLEQNREAIGIAVHTVLNHVQLQELFEQTQAQSEELQAQHSELENINAELEAQSEKLQASEEELRVQQGELQQSNQEMEERSRLLEERNQLIVEQNMEIRQKAEELAQSTRYKSEFLANMSHELRTPLNSVLLLSRLLSENNEKNLTNDQVEYARVIQSSGQGLLALIDEILDLSKIEAGKMELDYQPVLLQEIANDMKALFTPVAREKRLDFNIQIGEGLPSRIETDKLRLEQVLRNLLSNALKFTAQGTVELLVQADPVKTGFLAFTVKDTGIGIPEDKQALIFEAFQQADGSTRRKYGGTGLGLSISRELSRLLGGELTVSSTPGQGSAFTMQLPVHKMSIQELPAAPAALEEEFPLPPPPVTKNLRSEKIPAALPDDRETIGRQDKTILIIEDDTAFAKALLDFTHKKGYKGLVAVRGDEGIALAQQHKPAGILLDIQLPVKDGWEVMEELKSNPATRHIPVHTMSSLEVKKESLMKGAVDFINKPVAFEQMQEVFKKIEQVITKEHKKVLIIEENPKHAKALAYFLETFNVATEVSNSVSKSVDALKTEGVDCVILDMDVPDQQAYETLEELKKDAGLESLPIIIFTGRSLSKPEEQRIKQYADSIVIKTAHSYQRILDEVSLFLHLMEEQAQEGRSSRKYKRMGELNEVLSGKKILVTDDDVRNIFSLTRALEQYQVQVITAVDGKEALRMLKENPDTSAVLMDIMMPEMDGYEAMQQIRKQREFRNLPIIAVTAKAMTGDREKCIQAGASDYISKPVDVDQLLSLLRVWLYDKTI
jgi:signal transduction histidine kinase/DNA-binding response OmpR family regulator/CHASE3 domain sensor protein